MASAAQIKANQNNAKRSTGPRSAEAKKRVSMNALKHSLYAETVVPVSSEADPGREEEWIGRWARTVQPQNDIEWNLVRQAAQLSLEIERGRRKERELLEAWRHAQFREISRRLLYVVAAEEVKAMRMPPWTDDPGRFVSQLEVSAEGCRWLLDRWQEYRNLLDVQATWKVPEKVRFIRLQGKDVVESTYDPKLNATFLAWDVLDPECAKTHWGYLQRDKPINDPAFNDRLRWREVVDRPADDDAARALLCGIVNQHVARLQVLLAANEAREAAGDTDWAPRAGLDCSAAFERLRRAQSARHRELMKTIAELRKMGKEGFAAVAEEPDGVASSGGVASGELRVASENGVTSGQWPVASELAEDGETSPELSQGSFVGQDSNLVHDDSSNDEIGIFSHEEANSGVQMGQSDDAGQDHAESGTEVAAPQECADQSQSGTGAVCKTAGTRVRSNHGKSARTKPFGPAARESGMASGDQGNERIPATGVPRVPRLDGPESPGERPMNSAQDVRDAPSALASRDGTRSRSTTLEESSGFATKSICPPA